MKPLPITTQIPYRRPHKDLFQYLSIVKDRGNYLYLIKRVDSKDGIYSSIPLYYWPSTNPLHVKRLKVTDDLILSIKQSFSSLPSSISSFLWSQAQSFDAIKDRLLQLDVKGIILDLDRFDAGLFQDCVFKGKRY